jgi:flagellar basal body-associated protein FliL
VSHGAELDVPRQVESRPPSGSAPKPGQRTLVAVIVLTCLVVLFAAAVAIWMYWLQA